MAPPIPGLRRRVPVRRRTAGDVFTGILAVLALTALIVGVPIALITVLGLPIPHAAPTLSLLTHQLGVLTIIRILSVVVWLAWIQLVLCVLAEVTAAIRNVGVPTRVPLSGGTQALAHRLVTAALLLFSATATLSPAFAHGAPPPRPVIAATAVAEAGSQAQAELAGTGHEAAGLGAAQAAAPVQQPVAEKIYVVKPPVGRFHESLWEIAENHLGNGLRYREIFEMNKDRPQPDGTKLTIACLIRPGWVLLMPRDAYGPGVEIIAPGAPGGPAGLAEGAGALHADQATQAASGAKGTGTTASGAQAEPPVAEGPVPTAPPPAAVAPGAPAAPAAGAPAALSALPAGASPAFPYELSAASLLAAGVLAALSRRRREQLWQRAFGRRVVIPEGDAAMAEGGLRLGASEPLVRLLDTSLRSMSQELAARGKVPPAVFAAHLGPANLDLWIASADGNPPRPWLSVDDGQVWRLPLAEVANLDPDEAGAAIAPYPGLVSIGTSETGRMLVDIEVARGLISVRGPRHMVQSALAAMAVELATNRWSDGMRLILVGFGPELEMLAPERIVVARTLEEAWPALEARAAEIEQALATTGADSVLVGRSRGLHPDLWAPHYLIMAVPPTPRQRERLLALAGSPYRTAMGYLVAGDLPGASWSWDVTEQGRLLAGTLGFDLKAQLLPVGQYAALVELFRAAGRMEGVPLGAPSPEAAPAAQLVPGSRMATDISILGQLSVRAPGGIEPVRVGQATEIVVYLAAHPEGVHPGVLGVAIWPRGVTQEVRDAAIGRVRDWLGTDAEGRPNLVTDSRGRLSLGPQVRVDWQVFRSFAGYAGRARLQGHTGDEMAYLSRALDLVQGQLLDRRDPGRYAWLAADELEYEVTARVADAAHRLAELRLTEGDPQGAMDAARAGLRLAFNDELLWRDLLTATHATGQEHVLRAVVGEVSARVSLDEVLPRLAPRTEALIDELLPSWRSSVA
jgi:hypothetical protein